MSTVSTGLEKVLRIRRRPPKIAINIKSSRKVFGDNATKALLIPIFIDNYNHYIGGVDQVDQLGSYYNTQKKHLKTWKPLWHFLLDIAITNTYKIHHSCSRRTTYIYYSHKDFRIKLATDLFSHSERVSKGRPPPVHKPLTYYVLPDQASEHQYTTLGSKVRTYFVCLTAGRRPPPTTMKRKALGDLSVNVGRPRELAKKRKVSMKRTTYGYILCNIYICKNGSCWGEHIEAIR